LQLMNDSKVILRMKNGGGCWVFVEVDAIV